MKTTLEVPDDLYRKVKSRAALRRRKIKDFVAEGLRLALEADERGDIRDAGPLAVFEEIRANPLHQSVAIQSIIDASDRERKADWRDEG